MKISQLIAALQTLPTDTLCAISDDHTDYLSSVVRVGTVEVDGQTVLTIRMGDPVTNDDGEAMEVDAPVSWL